ncbi:hypothetical protein GJAV_G00086960 [Gymnothorax javanicus]|nr:hypothetical protein GJAV_G00086960 [Gymnothorax javanicus]
MSFPPLPDENQLDQRAATEQRPGTSSSSKASSLKATLKFGGGGPLPNRRKPLNLSQHFLQIALIISTSDVLIEKIPTALWLRSYTSEH